MKSRLGQIASEQFRQILLMQAAALDANPIDAAAAMNCGAGFEVDRVVVKVGIAGLDRFAE